MRSRNTYIEPETQTSVFCTVYSTMYCAVYSKMHCTVYTLVFSTVQVCGVSRKLIGCNQPDQEKHTCIGFSKIMVLKPTKNRPISNTIKFQFGLVFKRGPGYFFKLAAAHMARLGCVGHCHPEWRTDLEKQTHRGAETTAEAMLELEVERVQHKDACCWLFPLACMPQKGNI